MKALEKILILVAAACFLGTVGLAVFVVGTAAAKALIRSPAAEIAAVSDTAAEAAASVPAAQPAAEAVSAPVAVAAVSAEAGEKVFRKCKACHTSDEGGRNATGPNLWGVVNRAVASVEGFAYSDAMQAHAEEAWTPEKLDEYLENPRKAIPDNKMSFAGLKKVGDRQNVIAYLAAQSSTPQTPAELGFALADAAAAVEESEAESEEVVIDEVPYPEGVTYRNPSERSAEEQAEIDSRVAALRAEVEAGIDYERARYHPLHFPPNAAQASNEECLVCHQEILDHTPRATSPAGLGADQTLAWYQTLDTYEGDQQSFHYRHLESDFAKQVMNLECSFCHKGNDPREESPDMVRTRAAFSAPETPEFTLRKMVNPSETCLRCHGDFPYEVMDLEGPWHEIREDMEWPEAPNGCMSCHAETFRTNRHAVSYLNAETIEKLAREGSSDTCYGCHGGRQWYRTAYPFPRHPWPGMDPDEVPEWAVDRPTASDPEYALPASD